MTALHSDSNALDRILLTPGPKPSTPNFTANTQSETDKIMTLNALHKLTGKLLSQGHGRAKVSIDKATFYNPLEDEGCTIMDVQAADVQAITLADGDGFTDTDSKGRERVKMCLVMTGGYIG